MAPYRYAVYAVPVPDHPLWAAAAKWLGRDARQEGPIQKTVFADLVAEAARYGFHGTMKPPFRLAEGQDEAQLLRAVEGLMRSPLPVSLALRDDLGFPALRPVIGVPALDALAERCVRELDRFRAPLGAEELAKRRTASLSPRQSMLLEQWGYPYVMDQFRFHMTVGARASDENRHQALMSAAHRAFTPWLGTPVPLVLALFVEPEQGAPFRFWRDMASA